MTSKSNSKIHSNVKIDRMKADLERALSQVFLRRGFTYITFAKIYISKDFHYARIEIDAINHDIESVVQNLNSSPLHSEILKDLHSYFRVSNFPKIVFSKDLHKDRIEAAEKLINKIHEEKKI